PQAFAMLRQLAGSKIGFEDPKPQMPGWVVGLHGKSHAAPTFLATQAGDELPEIIDSIRFARGLVFQREGTVGPLKQDGDLITYRACSQWIIACRGVAE